MKVSDALQEWHTAYENLDIDEFLPLDVVVYILDNSKNAETKHLASVFYGCCYCVEDEVRRLREIEKSESDPEGTLLDFISNRSPVVRQAYASAGKLYKQLLDKLNGESEILQSEMSTSESG